MTAWDFTAVVWILSFLAGFLGALPIINNKMVVVTSHTHTIVGKMHYATDTSLV